MNEHKKYGGSAKPPDSLDGIISGGRQLGAPIRRSAQPKKVGPTSSSLGSMDRRADGFHVSRSGSASLGAPVPSPAKKSAKRVPAPAGGKTQLIDPLDEPIILDDLEDNTKRKKGNKQYQGPKKHRARKIIKRTVLTLLLLVLVGGGYFGFKLYATERNLFRGGGKAPALANSVDINQLKGEGDGRINVLLLGVGGPGHDGPDLTDTIMLASIDPINHKATLLSIPRDLWVKIPNYGSQKINAAYAYGKEYSKAKTDAGKQQDGLKLIDQTLQPIIGVPIHYHVVVDFQAFKDVVDNLGGVTVDVKEQLYDPTIAWENHNNPVIAKVGSQVMQGPQALLYARSRETSSDFARGERQRALIVGIKSKALSLGTFSNPIKISNLLSTLGSNVFTDLSLNDTSRMYQITSQIDTTQITSLDFVTPPNALITTGSMDGLSIDEPRAGLNDYSDMLAFVHSNLRDGFLAKENAPIEVYNATYVTGAATSEAAVLKTYGYNVTKVGDATITNSANTVLVDLSQGKDKYTRHYLENRLGVTARTALPDGSGITPSINAAFVIILGKDVATNPTQ